VFIQLLELAFRNGDNGPQFTFTRKKYRLNRLASFCILRVQGLLLVRRDASRSIKSLLSGYKSNSGNWL
jgi:hypothetical protein